ncbi:hypothetical protein CORT_0A03610 [Candida orthopsilosis Co 90-125]|uniref:Uncharacterized protein n=1 Tax=Candida orthopsilosis (strain 90-125) TaxID=1136231 RepID=H8WWC5_CANO9|nr:hypothetical protein CORT_0A03610 [Candida orthopsilosis Co 90-125]CCG20749.1 hypothetical protein CORT_0A03610 [Candida orthopsilosis Co 90-125]
MSQLLFTNVVSNVSTETVSNYAKFNDNIKCNLQVRQLYNIEYEMKSIDEVLSDEYYDGDRDWELVDGKQEKEEEEGDVLVYQFGFTSSLHSNSSILQLRYNHQNCTISSLTEPRFRISQSVSERIKSRNLSLLRVNTI